MLKRLICKILGHIYTAKAATGNTLQLSNQLTGSLDTVSLHKWEPLKFCPRCCTPNPHYEQLKKKSAEWSNYETGKPEAKPGKILTENFLPQNK